MSKQSTRARRAAPPPPKKKVWWPWALLAGVIVIALVIAIVSTLGSDEKVSQGTVGTDNSSSVAETQPVSVVGDALPRQLQPGVDETPLGLAAPTLKGFHFDGSSIDITPGGKAKMVVFLAHWCPHCNNEIPVLLSWRDAGQIPADLDIVGISTAANAQRDNYPPSDWLVRKGWTWPVLVDSADQEAAAAYGLGFYPTFVIVGADGNVKLRVSGEVPQGDLTSMVNQALAS